MTENRTSLHRLLRRLNTRALGADSSSPEFQVVWRPYASALLMVQADERVQVRESASPFHQFSIQTRAMPSSPGKPFYSSKEPTFFLSLISALFP